MISDVFIIFTKMPYLTLAVMLKYLDPITLLKMSIYAERLMIAVGRSHVQTASCNIKLRSTFRKEVSIELNFGDKNETTITWIIAKEYKQNMPVDWFGPLLLGTTRLDQCCHHFASNTYYTFGECLDTNMEIVLDFLFYVFSCTTQEVDMDENMLLHFSKSTGFLAKRQCDKLKIRASEKTSKASLEKVLNSFSAVETCEIGCYMGRDLDTEKLSNYRQIILNDALWLSSDSFLKIDCEHIHLHEHNLLGEDINTFINMWQCGKKEKLRSFSISFEDDSMVDPTCVLNGLEIAEFDVTKRHRYYRLGNMAYDCCYALDIMSDDGQLASLLFDSSRLHFFVWKELYPDFSLPTGQYFTRITRTASLEARYPIPAVFGLNIEALWDTQARVVIL